MATDEFTQEEMPLPDQEEALEFFDAAERFDAEQAALPEEERAPQGFTIKDRAEGDIIRAGVLASGLVWLYGKFERRLLEIKEQARVQRQQIDQWERGEVERYEFRLQHLAMRLLVYVTDFFHPRERTVRTSAGDLRRRKGRDQIVLSEDTEAIIEFLLVADPVAYDLYVTLKPTLDKVGLKKYLKKMDSGEVLLPDGEMMVVITEQGETRLATVDHLPETFKVVPKGAATQGDEDE